MNKYNITNCGKQFIVNADSEISAIKKLKDAKKRKLNDSWLGKNVSTQLGTGSVIDYKEILEKGKIKRIWSVKLDNTGYIVNTCWITFNGFKYDSAIKDAQARKVADRSLIGRKVKTSIKYLGKVVDVEYDGHNIQLRVELLEGPGAGQTIYQRLDDIKINDSALRDAKITDKDSVDAQHMSEYGWTIEADLPRTVYWDAVEELAGKLKSEEEYKREIVKLARKKFENAIVDIKREFEKIIASGRKKTSLYESWVGEQSSNIMKKQVNK